MIKYYYFTVLLTSCLTLGSCSDSKNKTNQTESIKTTEDSISYSLGVTWAELILNKTGMQTENYSLIELVNGFKSELHTKAIFDSLCLNKIKEFEGNSKKSPELKKEVSYCLGKFYAHGFITKWIKPGGMKKINLNIVSSGFSDIIMKKEVKIAKEKRSSLHQMFYQRFIDDISNIMMDSVKLKKNVQKIENDIYIETLLNGNGTPPNDSSDVILDYILSTPLNDTVENSYKRLSQKIPPPKFNIKQMYKGWSFVFPKIKKGGKYRIYMPFEMFNDQRLPFPYICFYIDFLDFGDKGSLVIKNK
tara:strand:- start:1682 stop:2593 length:912 start_codon:yes stop_codon:yes gene_type:complete